MGDIKMDLQAAPADADEPQSSSAWNVRPYHPRHQLLAPDLPVSEGYLPRDAHRVLRMMSGCHVVFTVSRRP